MKVIGAGLPRTGTLSQKVALEMLGLGPCYHMVNILSDLDLADRWRHAVEGRISPAEMLEGFQATVDWPGSFFYRDLIDVYPDAKVLLSVRPADAWTRSMQDTIWGVIFGDNLVRHMSDAWMQVDPQWRGYMGLMREMWRRSGLIAGAATTMDEMGRAMERHNDEVVRVVPADRLLVWSVGDGWEPLCAFLEVPVPDAEFPRVNDSKAFGERIIDGAMAAIQQHRAGRDSVGAVR